MDVNEELKFLEIQKKIGGGGGGSGWWEWGQGGCERNVVQCKKRYCTILRKSNKCKKPVFS